MHPSPYYRSVQTAFLNLSANESTFSKERLRAEALRCLPDHHRRADGTGRFRKALQNQLRWWERHGVIDRPAPDRIVVLDRDLAAFVAVGSSVA